MQELLGRIFSDLDKGKIRRTRIMESAAIAAYHQQTDFPVVDVILSDGAPQFRLLTREQALCWIHDGLPYKKLHPVVPLHSEKLEMFRGLYWDYYRKLAQYKENPTQEEMEAISAEFDGLFSMKTGHLALDDRIAKTRNKNSELRSIF